MKKLLIPLFCVTALAFAGCAGNRASEGQKAEHKIQQQIEDNYAQAQPVPALTNPDGVYTGESSGTYVLCIEAKGQPYVSYWEGSVLSEFAPAKWNYDQHTVELLGSSSWEFSKHTPTSVTK